VGSSDFSKVLLAAVDCYSVAACTSASRLRWLIDLAMPLKIKSEALVDKSPFQRSKAIGSCPLEVLRNPALAGSLTMGDHGGLARPLYSPTAR